MAEWQTQLRCPADGSPLSEVDQTQLGCSSCGTRYPVVSGIPRFVESEHLESFGFQWNRYEVAHAEAQGFAQQIGWAHNKADLKSSGRVLGLPSDAVPKKGQPPKVRI